MPQTISKGIIVGVCLSHASFLQPIFAKFDHANQITIYYFDFLFHSIVVFCIDLEERRKTYHVSEGLVVVSVVVELI